MGDKPVVLVTGGAGYVGSQTCKELAARGYVPVTLDNLVNGHRETVRWGPFEEGDIGDKAFVSAVLKRHKPKAVVHCAALCDVGECVTRPDKYYENNVVGTLRLLECLQEHDINNFVFSSTCATYGDVEEVPITEDTPQAPINPYGVTKLMCEQIMKDFGDAYGLRYVFFRYFNVAGADLGGELGEQHEPPSHVIPIIFDSVTGKTDSFKIFGDDYDTPDGTCIRDYVHVADLADGHVRAVEHLLKGGANDIINLGSGQGFSVKELIAKIEEVSGKKVPTELVPRRPGDAPCLYANKDKAKRVLGWEPVNSNLDTIMKTAWEWCTRNEVSAVG